MDLPKILAQLRQERELVEEAIVSFERLATASGGRRRGRPPAWLKAKRELRPEERSRVMTAGSTHE
jgi:hypothetical protein